MKYFSEIVSDVLQNKKFVHVEEDGLSQHIHKHGANDDEVLVFHKEVNVIVADLPNSQSLYRFDTRICDFISNVTVNGQTNFQYGYTNCDFRLDYQPHMVLAMPACVHPLFLDLSGYQTVKLEYDCYIIMNDNDKKKLMLPPYILANVNRKYLTYVDDPPYHCGTFINVFDTMDRIMDYYKQLNKGI